MFQICLRYIQQLDITFVHKLYRLTKRSCVESQFSLGKMCKDLRNLCYPGMPYDILFATFNFSFLFFYLFICSEFFIHSILKQPQGCSFWLLPPTPPALLQTERRYRALFRALVVLSAAMQSCSCRGHGWPGPRMRWSEAQSCAGSEAHILLAAPAPWLSTSGRRTGAQSAEMGDPQMAALAWGLWLPWQTVLGLSCVWVISIWPSSSSTGRDLCSGLTALPSFPGFFLHYPLTFPQNESHLHIFALLILFWCVLLGTLELTQLWVQTSWFKPGLGIYGLHGLCQWLNLCVLQFSIRDTGIVMVIYYMGL